MEQNHSKSIILPYLPYLIYICPPPMTFNNTINTLHSANIDVAGNEIKESLMSLKKQTLAHYEEDTAVLCGGTWQRHGYSFLNSVVNAINIDTERFRSFLEMGLCSSILNFDSGTHNDKNLISWTEVWFLYERVF